MEDEHDRIADERLEEADRIQEPSKDLERDIKQTREEWEQKQKLEAVPGAVDPDKFYPDEDDEEKLPEPEYEQLNPQSADASGGGQDESDEDDS
jgi:hypothetical protein